MKMTRLFAMIIAAACLLACMPLVSASGDQGNNIDPFTGDHAITIDQAKDSVRAFVGDTSVEPIFFTEEELPLSTYYVFGIGNSVFMVNADNGAVEMAWFEDNVPKSPTGIEISEDEAYEKAVAYASQKSEDFSKKNWTLFSYKLDGPADDDRGYVFNFQEQIRSENDTVLLNMVEVIVNPDTGAIYQYQSMNRIKIEENELIL